MPIARPAPLRAASTTVNQIPRVINRKTAKSLGLAVPDKLLTLADDLIE